VRILLVDDEADLVDLVCRALVDEGHRVDVARTAAQADYALLENSYEVIVLDLGLPDGSGLDVCRRARAAQISTPVLMLTAQTAVETRVESLDTGADDFLGKPFAVAELKARIRALGRRSGLLAALVWAHGTVSLDFPRRRATVSGEEVPVTAKEWNILEVLALSQGRLVSRARILDEVWGDSGSSAESSLEVLINRIRKKLGSDCIHTLRGEGYRLG
jgi:DNA-binding response OmpR family regulator